MMRKHLALALCILSFAATADYSEHPKAAGLIERLTKERVYERDELIALLRAAQRRPELIESERKAPERTKTWPEYQAIFLQPKRIHDGVAFLQKHADSFARAEKRFGVPRQLVAAIIGVETLYGGYTGPHRVLDSLATQGFEHPSRSEFFFSEFEQFLRLCKDMGMDPLSVAGSYAGAMGMPQFMPSNYRRLALDFNQDGHIDLWQPDDAIGSAAHYLSRFLGKGRDWQRGEAVAYPIAIRDGSELAANPKQPDQHWKDLRKHLQGGPDLGPDQRVALLRLEHPDRPEYWVALPNFYSIMSYNPRVYYAMAVYQLSQAIAEAAAS